MYPFRPNLTWAIVKYHRFSTSSSARAGIRENHYSNLQIEREATQNEIKTAYYKLSKLYHPDKNKGSTEAANKFREITAAYEVLGNVRKRKLYDRGLANTESIYEAPSYESEPQDTGGERVSDFHKARHTRKPSKIYTGRTEEYNFDAWTRAHYSMSFDRIRESRGKGNMKKSVNIYHEDQDPTPDFAYSIVFLVISALFFYEIFLPNNYDDPALIEKRKLALSIAAPGEDVKHEPDPKSSP